MNALRMSSSPPAGFAMEKERRGSEITLRLVGNADMNAIDRLDERLETLHDEAATTAVSRVRVDFRELEFMNSSCFKCFVSWVGKLQDLPTDRRYAVVFVSNGDLHWQRRNLRALRCFAMDIISIES
jgi:hypothetical protein